MSGPRVQRHRCTCSPPCPPDGVCIQAVINRLATRSDSCLHLDRSTEKVLLFDKERWEVCAFTALQTGIYRPLN